MVRAAVGRDSLIASCGNCGLGTGCRTTTGAGLRRRRPHGAPCCGGLCAHRPLRLAADKLQMYPTDCDGLAGPAVSAQPAPRLSAGPQPAAPRTRPLCTTSTPLDAPGPLRSFLAGAAPLPPLPPHALTPRQTLLLPTLLLPRAGAQEAESRGRGGQALVLPVLPR